MNGVDEILNMAELGLGECVNAEQREGVLYAALALLLITNADADAVSRAAGLHVSPRAAWIAAGVVGGLISLHEETLAESEASE